ncbi:O-antigen acetylase [Acinetobacter sp. LoGeW2-3]|uniref:acyltransferase family protein n=1 Tax=Acinetobacter sp. LoGeW2-3 TaxID=1808001 RepID=UPI000C05C773|nr:acyltransferase family protein [Acinetobacter sp. LoGeW2-3]ATO19572.1 O-antigen acetylase [Acinetobacter sp. LoGeW2-3]
MSIRYNPVIDGLRALAVLLVIFNHIGIHLFSGGFIGVDIFFVISGYLITSIIYKDMKLGNFSIGSFYKKRVIRLAPAFFTVLTVVSIISWFSMLPHELAEYAKSAVYSTFLMANVYMRKEVGGYFSTSVEEVPLLHLWSLGVEEQFYLFWPLLLLMLIRKTNPKWMLWIIIGLIIASVFYAEQQILKNAGKAYYRMPVRACEMFLGALISFLPVIRIKDILAKLLIYLATISLCITAILFNEETKFPGLNALIPCLLTASIIYFSQTLQQQTILSSSAFLWIGKISYPMYLWHWTIIAFLNIYLINIDFYIQVSIILLTIALAWLTYIYCEKPARKWVKISNKKVLCIGFLLPSLSFASMSGFIQINNGLPGRFEPIISQQVEALQSAAHFVRKECHDAPKDRSILPEASLCSFGERDKANIDLLVLGDSHANSLIGALEVWAKAAGMRGYDPTQSTSLYLPGVALYERKTGDTYVEFSSFKVRNESLTSHLASNHYPIIVVSGYFSTYLSEKVKLDDGTGRSNEEIFVESFKKGLDNIYQSTDRVILIHDVPELFDLQANCNTRVNMLKLNHACTTDVQSLYSRDKRFLQILDRIKVGYSNLEIVNLNSIICDELVCQSHLNNIPLYRDKDLNHLSFIGASILGKEYLRLKGNPLIIQ